jgi:hypothetical protein
MSAKKCNSFCFFGPLCLPESMCSFMLCAVCPFMCYRECKFCQQRTGEASPLGDMETAPAAWEQGLLLVRPAYILTFFTMHSLVCRVGNALHTLVDLSSVAPCVLCSRLRFSWKEGSGAANGTTFITINTWTSRLTNGYSVDKCTAWFQVLTCYCCCASWCCTWRGKSLLHSWLIYPFLACPKSDIVTRFLFFSDGRSQRLEWKQSSSSGAPHGGMQLSWGLMIMK